LATKYGKEKILDLFPELMPARFEQPIYEGFTLPRVPNLSPDQSDFVSDIQWVPELLQPFSSNGSNNWAISGTNSRTKTTILANDPHLSFTLPGVWFEQELIGPQTHVYGAGFAGAPGVMTGF